MHIYTIKTQSKMTEIDKILNTVSKILCDGCNQTLNTAGNGMSASSNPIDLYNEHPPQLEQKRIQGYSSSINCYDLLGEPEFID